MVYKIGFIFVILVILISIDDLIWDIFYFISKIFGKFKRDIIYKKDVEAELPKMLAIIVAAYNEESVLKPVIENMVKSSQYPDSMYRIFLGVYPNDPGTLKVADELVEEFKNVEKVVHYLEGPSSKADNLNNVLEYIASYEKENHLEFAAVVIHDSEDLIHPYEFKLENYLLEKYPAIQMPVFPLQLDNKWDNIGKNLISNTYVDEFAENHYRLLVARTATGAFVPSAGTGFVIRRDVLESFPDYNIFPVGSLTEDYKLSLEIKQMGYDVHYVLDEVHKILDDNRVRKEFIATRSMFPNNYWAAVRQKTRWIYGITFQSFSLGDILKNKKLNFQSKYSLYRDWKAKFGNLLLGPGYLIFCYFILSIFLDLDIMYPKYSPSWYLMVFLSIMMIERQFLRFLALKNVYGFRTAFTGVLLPPLLPLRMVVGNIINFHATLKSWMIKLSLNKNKSRRKKLKWSKTDHEFLDENRLKSHRRNLEDMLLYKGYLSLSQLKRAKKLSKSLNKELYRYLLDEKIVDEDSLVQSVCEVEHKVYIRLEPGRYLNYYVRKYDEKVLKKIRAIPLIMLGDEMEVITTLDSDKSEIERRIRSRLGNKKIRISYLYTGEKRLLNALNNPVVDEVLEEDLKKLESYIRASYINIEQSLLALTYHEDSDIDTTLIKMGLLRIETS